MSVFSCSVHTHAQWCHGKDSLEAMAAAAFAAGVKHYGVSCHSHTPIPLDEGFVLDADMTAYRRAVLDLRAAYEGRMEVLLGLEWDSQSDVPPRGFDYWIGSVHYQKGENGLYYCPNWSGEHFACCRDGLFGGDALAVAEGYYREVARVAALRPTILGHFDLIAKRNAALHLFDEEAGRYRLAALEALHAADPGATLLEINTGGMERGARTTPYPALFILKAWRARGGRVILTSDAHSAGRVLYGYSAAADLARAAGYDRASILTLAGEKECRI